MVRIKNLFAVMFSLLALTLYFIALSIGESQNHGVITDILILIAIILGVLSILIYIFNFLGRADLFVIWVSIILIAMMCLCPPWNKVFLLPNSNIKASDSIGYQFLFDPPKKNRTSEGITIDFVRLTIQCGLVILVASGALFTIKCKSKAKNDQ